MRLAFSILAMFLLVSCSKEPAVPESTQSSDQNPPVSSVQEVFSGRLSPWRESGDFLGAGWIGPSGLVIDDINDFSGLQAAERAVAEGLVTVLKPRGVISCADFTYNRKDRPANITLRIFVFKDMEAARSWWKTKYESPEAKDLYKKVDGMGDMALDSLQMAKRIVLSKNVLMTCGQLHDNEDHLKVLDRYFKKLRF